MTYKGGAGTIQNGLIGASDLAKNALNAKIPFSGYAIDAIKALVPGPRQINCVFGSSEHE